MNYWNKGRKHEWSSDEHVICTLAVTSTCNRMLHCGEATRGLTSISALLQNQLQRSSDTTPTVNAALVGPTLIGQRCWVRWPYLQEAIVEGVSDSTEKVCHPACLILHKHHFLPPSTKCRSFCEVRGAEQACLFSVCTLDALCHMTCRIRLLRSAVCLACLVLLKGLMGSVTNAGGQCKGLSASQQWHTRGVE